MKNNRGFTIIEVVLVLAIAGLIFLMVFLALPALQRSQRDTLRRRQVQMYIEAFNRAKANNRGSVPLAKVDKLVELGYLKEEEMQDPLTGEVYSVDENAALSKLYENYNEIPVGKYGISHDGGCENNIPVKNRRGYSSRVVVFALEGGGWICADTAN